MSSRASSTSRRHALSTTAASFSSCVNGWSDGFRISVLSSFQLMHDAVIARGSAVFARWNIDGYAANCWVGKVLPLTPCLSRHTPVHAEVQPGPLQQMSPTEGKRRDMPAAIAHWVSPSARAEQTLIWRVRGCSCGVHLAIASCTPTPPPWSAGSG